MKYKNLFLAYSIEIIIGFLTSILIILFGAKALAFIALLAIRPFVLDKEQISPQDDFWYKSFQLGKNALIILSVIIIFFSIFVEMLNESNFLWINSNVIDLEINSPKVVDRLVHRIVKKAADPLAYCLSKCRKGRHGYNSYNSA